jgi:hypothetical protein
MRDQVILIDLTISSRRSATQVLELMGVFSLARLLL